MYEALAADPRFSTFVGLLRDAGFARDLDVPAPGFTIFAPTNDAFDRMDPEERAAWTSDPAQLRALLAYHGVDPDAGVLAPGDFTTGRLRSIHGAELEVDVDGSTVTVNTGRLGTPLEASNGAPYPIDIVLVPPAG